MNLSKVSTYDLVAELKSRESFIDELFIEPRDEFKIMVRPNKKYIKKWCVDAPEVIDQKWKTIYKDSGIAGIIIYVD